MRTMDRLVPDWTSQNDDRGFIDWLQLVDPRWGFKRQDLLDQAAGRYDAERVASIFNAYRDELAAKSGQSRLASQVSPTHTAGSTPVSGPKKWTSEAIATFYEEARHGKYSDEDIARIEKEIDDAVASGQVRY